MSAKDLQLSYPKVLIITRNGWNSNCTGNTLSNFFEGWPKEKIANAFFRAENIDNNVCTEYYKVTEYELVKKFFCKKNIGKHIKDYKVEENVVSASEIDDTNITKSYYSFFSKHRWNAVIWLRDILWGFNGWKNKKYDDFLEDFSPDVIYMPCYDSVYMHRILRYTAKKTGARVVMFTGDDTYTLKQFSLSPLFWMNRFINRYTMRKSLKITETLFVISELQKTEYDKIFKRDCVILRKGGNFNLDFSPKDDYKLPIKLVYTGNIHLGRWKTLAKLVDAIKEINSDGKKLEIDIYSLSSKSNKMIQALNVDGCSKLMPPATDLEIKQALEDADILVFVEPFELKERLKWRLSFSTKIVDYLSSSRAILAIGPENLSSMDFLKRNDAAFCVNSCSELKSKLEYILNTSGIIDDYAKKAWKCGNKNNRIEDTKETLYKYLQGGNPNGEAKQFDS